MRFDEHQNRFIAEFFVDHYDEMTNSINKPRGARRKAELERELMNKFNDIFGTELTDKQIHDKIKNMKKAAKTKMASEANQSIEDTLRRAEMDPQSAAIDMMIERMRSGPLAGDHSVARDHQSYLPNEQQDGQPVNAPPSRYRLADDAHNSHGSSVKRARVINNDTPPASDGVSALQKSLFIIQKQVAEKELKVLSAKEAAISKFNLAVDEFRRYVAEQRILCRGLSLGNTPVDIPPGLEGILDQM